MGNRMGAALRKVGKIQIVRGINFFKSMLGEKNKFSKYKLFPFLIKLASQKGSLSHLNPPLSLLI